MTEKLARKRTGAFCHHTPLKGRDDAPARERPESRGVSEPDSPRSAMAYVIMRALRVNMEPCKPQCTWRPLDRNMKHSTTPSTFRGSGPRSMEYKYPSIVHPETVSIADTEMIAAPLNRCAALLAAVVLFAPVQGVPAQEVTGEEASSPIARIATSVERELSGDSALKTVAFVEGRWRLPGNTGFNESLDHVVAKLASAGYQPESASTDARLTYRVETRPMSQRAWEPVDASLTIAGADSALLKFATNRNMLAINSHSTAANGVEAELVDGGNGSPEALDAARVRGKIVFARAPISRLYQLEIGRAHV